MTSRAKLEERVVLLVDDDPDFLEQHRLLLERAGYAVRSATSEEEATELIQKEKFDAAVLDLMLEHDDGGFILAHRIRKVSRMPIILVTAVTSERGVAFETNHQEDRAWLEADVVLTKPIRFEQLTRELDRLLQG